MARAAAGSASLVIPGPVMGVGDIGKTGVSPSDSQNAVTRAQWAGQVSRKNRSGPAMYAVGLGMRVIL